MSFTPETSPVIDETGEHRRLVEEVDHFAKLAGIPKAAIWVPLDQVASELEVKWARNFRKHDTQGIQGMIWTGKHSTVMHRAQALAGCLVRNFIDARLRTLDQSLETFEECSCLIIPDLYIGETVKDWQRDKVLRLLMKHQQRGSRVVAYISDLDSFSEAYGEMGTSLIKNFPKMELA